MSQVRIALDIGCKNGEEEQIAAAIFEDRKKILDFISNVVIPSNDDVAALVTKGRGGNSHVHSDDRDDMPCSTCKRYGDRAGLAKVEE